MKASYKKLWKLLVDKDILGFAAFYCPIDRHSLSGSPVWVFGVKAFALIAFPGVGIRNVQEQRTVLTQNAPDLCKNISQTRYIFLRGILTPDLSVHAVIPQRIIRRGCHTALDAVIGKSLQDFKTVTGIDCIKLYRYQLLLKVYFAVPR